MTVILLKVRFCPSSKDITVWLIAEWEHLIPWEWDSTSRSAYHTTWKENSERANSCYPKPQELPFLKAAHLLCKGWIPPWHGQVGWGYRQVVQRRASLYPAISQGIMPHKGTRAAQNYTLQQTEKSVSLSKLRSKQLSYMTFYRTNHYFILLPRHSLSCIQHIYYLGRGFFVLSSERPFGSYKLTPPMHSPTLTVQKQHLHYWLTTLSKSKVWEEIGGNRPKLIIPYCLIITSVVIIVTIPCYMYSHSFMILYTHINTNKTSLNNSYNIPLYLLAHKAVLDTQTKESAYLENISAKVN